jgi:hypothetical protein
MGRLLGGEEGSVKEDTMDTETLTSPCIECGRTTHRLLFDGSGRALCGSVRRPGYEPPGCARWDTTDELGDSVTRYVRATRNYAAAASEIGPWSFTSPDGRPLPEEPPIDIQREAIRLRTA